MNEQFIFCGVDDGDAGVMPLEVKVRGRECSDLVLQWRAGGELGRFFRGMLEDGSFAYYPGARAGSFCGVFGC